MSAYRIRPLAAADLPLIARWLRTPEVRRWWGDPEEQLALITEDLDQPAMRQWIVGHDAVDFAYLQAYRPSVWPQAHLAHLPAEAEAIDVFIGERGMLGRGHGSALLRQFAEQLRREGAPVIAVDPDRDNNRARRAYARAGFVEVGIVDTENGAVVVMLFT